jgi:hypothetical protein
MLHGRAFWTSKPPEIPEELSNRPAKIVEVEVSPRTVDPLSHLRSAILVIEGLCKKLRVKRRLLKPGSSYYSHRFFTLEINRLEPNSLNQYNFVYFDHPL